MERTILIAGALTTHTELTTHHPYRYLFTVWPGELVPYPTYSNKQYTQLSPPRWLDGSLSTSIGSRRRRLIDKTMRRGRMEEEEEEEEAEEEPTTWNFAQIRSPGHEPACTSRPPAGLTGGPTFGLVVFDEFVTCLFH